jgi:hypothetical protein
MTLFDPHTFGPCPGDRAIERPRRVGDLRRLWRRVQREHWTAQIVLVLGAVAIAAVVFVVGLLVGAGVAPWFAFDRHVSVIYRPLAPPVGTSPMRPAVEHDCGRLHAGEFA